MAKMSPVQILAAKEAAVQNFLPTTAPAAEFAALTASTAPEQNIVGVGIGRKLKKGKATDTIAIRFYVERKVPKSAVPKADVVPASIGGVPTDIIETGRLFAQQGTTPIARTRLRPAKGGCSIGFEGDGFVMAGTLGCLVTDGKDSFILSNNHVIANENSLPLKSPIFQPGTLDGGSTAKDRIASLTKMIKILTLPSDNHVDAAIAALDKKSLGSPLILPKVGKLSSSTTIPAAEKMRVHKHGRTTGYTQGRVTDIAADVNIQYDFGVARFVDQIVIVGDEGSFSDSGDSGSLIVDRKTNRATGLLFAGSQSHTIANPIDEVLTALGVTLLV
jgi:hypothetical protein